MKIYLICPVRHVSSEQSEKIQAYVAGLEREGHSVHYPPRDVDQDDPTGLEICTNHRSAMVAADRVDIWWDPNSTGSHFDLGMAFALNKRINLVEIWGQVPSGKSFAALIKELVARQPPIA